MSPAQKQLSVAALLQALTGCGVCPDPVTGEHTIGLYPTEDELAELYDDGNLSEEACEALCRTSAEEYYDQATIDAITSCGPDDASTADPTTPVPGDTGAEQVALTCTFTGTVQERCKGGRAHAAIRSRSPDRGSDPVLAWLGAAAHDEAASVKSFVTLARELEALGAPPELVAGCHAAARDEVAHARLVGGVAARRGAEAPALRFAPVPPRSLREVAVENVVEGCVHEVWAAALAHWQAIHAADPQIRAIMAPIARDEARHGDLARAIHAWALEHLDAEARDEVFAAREAAVEALLASLAAPTHPGLGPLGLPSSDEARRLGHALARELWQEAAVA